MTSREDDLRLLRRLLELEVDDEHDFPSPNKISESEHRAFSDMLSRLEDSDYRLFTHKQREWLKNVKERALSEPEYLNAWSAGKVPQGRPVSTPSVLQNLPKKPPPRPKSQD